MKGRKESLTWTYFFEPEDWTTPDYGMVAGTCKIFFLIAVSFLMSMGIGQLT